MFEFLKRDHVDLGVPTITEVMPPGLTRAEADAVQLKPGEEVTADLRRHFVVAVPLGSIVNIVEVTNG